jgi:hypothetical protein
MLPVRVTVAVGRKVVPLDEVKDPRVSSALREAARDLGVRLAKVTCPAHGKPASDVRLHFDARGAGDIKYESCCEKLGDAVARVL